MCLSVGGAEGLGLGGAWWNSAADIPLLLFVSLMYTVFLSAQISAWLRESTFESKMALSGASLALPGTARPTCRLHRAAQTAGQWVLKMSSGDVLWIGGRAKTDTQAVDCGGLAAHLAGKVL